MQKKRSIFFLCLLTAAAALFFSQCGYRPDGIRTSNSLSSPVEEVTTPEPTAVPVKTVTVTYRHDGKILSTEEVPEGESPSHVPGFSGDRGILTWTLAGAEVDVWNTPVWDPAVYDARLGPQLERNGGYFAAESDGLFHPLNTFTRSDAVRAVYELLDSKPTGETFLKDVTTHARCWQAATTLVTAGYMTLDSAGRFYPDVAISRADLSALLGRIFSHGAVEDALKSCGDKLTRGEAAVLLDTLLEQPESSQTPYFPDVSPDMAEYESVERAGIQSSISWVRGERAEPGFVNLEGYLYCVGEDGYFLRDVMKGTLYFDITGQYTCGDTALDDYVADIIEKHTKSSMSRDDMLKAVYVYVRDSYLYLKRSLYSTGDTGWEIPEALKMFQTGKGNCYNFSGAFWALARGVGYEAVCYSGLVGRDRDPHSWVEIEFDGVPYIFDVETEMSNLLVKDYTSMYKITYERGELWSYVRDPELAARLLAEKAAQNG